MSKTWAVFKREFGEQVRTKTFLLGTLFGPAVILLIMFLPPLFMSSGGSRRLVIVDGSGSGIGPQIARTLALPGLTEASSQQVTTYYTKVMQSTPAEWPALRVALRDSIDAGHTDGYLYLPQGILSGGTARFEGKVIGLVTESEIRSAVQQAVQQRRLTAAGIDPELVRRAALPVNVEARKIGEQTASGDPQSLFVLAQALGFSIYFVVLLYGQSIMRGVLEEKRGNIVELVLSSVRATRLMLGKILGIGGASLLQMLVWTVFGAIALTRGVDFMLSRGNAVVDILPALPRVLGIVFLTFFFGGFVLYAAVFAAIGAIATTDQEAQQLVFPAMIPLLIGFFMMFGGLVNSETTAFVAGSFIPFTSPVVMPVRVAMTPVPLWQMGLSLLLLLGTAAFVVWTAGKIYRIGILATGKRPSLSELLRWIGTE